MSTTTARRRRSGVRSLDHRRRFEHVALCPGKPERAEQLPDPQPVPNAVDVNQSVTAGVECIVATEPDDREGHHSTTLRLGDRVVRRDRDGRR